MDGICTMIQEKYTLDRERNTLGREVNRLEAQLPQAVYKARKAKMALVEYESGFRQRIDKLKGTFSQKQEALSAAVRQAEAARDALRRELDGARHRFAQLEKASEEMPTREELFQRYPQLAYLKQQDALLCTQRMTALLEQNETWLLEARDWAENRNAEFRAHPYGTAYDKDIALSKAADCAQEIFLLNAQLQEDEIYLELHGYFQNPHGFIAGAARQYGQQDRINYAIRAVRETHTMLRELQQQLDV